MYLKFYKHGEIRPYKVVKHVTRIDCDFTETLELLIHVYVFGSYSETITFKSYFEYFVLDDQPAYLFDDLDERSDGDGK